MTLSPRFARTTDLEVAYLESGEAAGVPVVLLHGFPYDVSAYDEVARRLHGARVIVPWLRGFGPTRFRSDQLIRSGQQAALGTDLFELLDALQLERCVVAGYDWGGRAACILAALHPERVSGLVTVDGYNVQDLSGQPRPLPPEDERRRWYQYYLHSQWGAAAFAADPEEFARVLWETWSPTWTAGRGAFQRSRESLANPDFVEVVVHSYRHRFGLAEGDPRLQPVEDALAERPPITVPTIVLEAGADGVTGSPRGDIERAEFTGRYAYRLIEGVGHNVPQEAPVAFAAAVQELIDGS
ncbi:alpha/beta fold hydrolase [Leifsonia poae]|uniref:Alpha/beta hydrolase n=1 Tax=Leifsonia poae TaxID=110933 RepID=A0A9W6LZX5_9MICO|nr:alpha/beta hydrolase [Leifsonia poae]GLJ76157.1 alpha/beta hydrolase [Leifsonia poae]